MSAFDPKRTSDRRRSGPPPVVIGDVVVAVPTPSDRGGFPLLLIMAGTTPVRKGRDTLAGLFASGMALASDVEVNVLAAFPSGNCIAAHWTTTVRTKAGQEAKAEGIDVLEVNVQGLIVRAEGYWNAAAFREALA